MISASITAKQTPIVGKWLLTKVEMDGKLQEVYQEVEFKSDGYMAMMGRVLGEWSVDKKAKTLTIDSDMVKEFAGTRTIKNHSKDELILIGENDKMYFTALDPKKIEKENKKSKLAGTWIIKNEEGTKYLTFELPDNFKTLTKTEYSTSKSSGSWYFNSKEKTIVFIAYDRELRGKNNIVSKTESKLVIEKNDKQITALKQDEKAVKKASEIERLKFTQGDFYTDEGDPKYETDVEKLPWKDQYKMYKTLKAIKSLDYERSTLIEETKTFEVKALSANLTTDSDYEVISFDNIFSGFDRSSLPEDTEMPTLNIESNNDNFSYVPFPYESYTFRIVNNDEQVEVKAGSFTCTTVELFSDNEEKVKLWMINDKPGVVAKIIIEKEDVFGELQYRLFELTKIQ